ncbi:uncharacterized protein LOC126156275 [Schistocerca cancellata]|uniref:uncharacterized protein LOC126156275 n=1 Tax=Schistocerca cancellata TaxID=274614 RepID=UPI002118ABFB|nr:uncharacterized protein LOC126156275 [Schistocerca cancellata]
MVLETVKKESHPDWACSKFLVRAFKQAGFDVEEDSIQVNNACSGGGGFMSETLLLRGRTLGGDVASLVVKASLQRGGDGALISDMLFRRESVLYTRTLPAAEAALKAAEGGAWRPLWPACPGLFGGAGICLLLEDVGAAGFHKAPSAASARGLDLEHCLVAMRGLARLHAATARNACQDAQAEPLLRESVFFGSSQGPLRNLQTKTTILKMVEILSRYPWFLTYKDKFLQFADKLLLRAVDAVSRCDNKLTVMLHGDFQKNNMMFRYSDEELEVIFYDYQAAHIGSPAEDLQYFLHTSASLEVLQQHTDLLLSEYHRTLHHTLRALGLQEQAVAYPLNQLRREMEQLALVGVFCTYVVLPVMLNLAAVDFDQDTSSPSFAANVDKLLQKCYTNPEYLSFAEYLTPIFEKNCLLGSRVSSLVFPGISELK